MEIRILLLFAFLQSGATRNRTGQTQQLVLKRIQPQGENAQVELETVDFAQLLAWLDLLEQQYGITPQQIELQSLPGLAGKVQVKRLLLGRNKK